LWFSCVDLLFIIFVNITNIHIKLVEMFLSNHEEEEKEGEEEELHWQQKNFFLLDI